MEHSDAGTDGLRSSGDTEANEFSGTSRTSPSESRTDFSAPDTGGHGLRDRARSALDSAGGRLADLGSGARDKVGVAKDKLASALESGADRLRERGGTTPAAATPGGTTVRADGRVAQVSDRVAGGMEATADWLRTTDLDSLRGEIENQVKQHPGRTLLIAAGLGYLIGRAFRGGSSST